MSDGALLSRIVRGFKTTLIADVVSMASKGILLVVLARYLLTPDQFGLLFLAMAVLAVGQLFADLGFAKSVARYVAEFQETDETQVRHIVRVGLSYNLLAIILVGAVIFLLRTQIADLLGEPALVPFLLIGPAYVGFRSLVLFHRVVFQGFNRVTWSALLVGVSSVAQVVFVVGFVLLDYGTVGAFLGYTAAFAVAAAVGLLVLYSRFYTALPQADAPRSDLARRILEYNFPLAWTRGAGVLDHRIDAVLVGYFLTPTAVGFYMLGKQISEFVMAPAMALGFVVSPTYGSEAARDERERAARLYETSFEHVVLLYVPAAAGIVLVAEETIRLVFGSAYLGAVPVVQVLGLFVVVKAVDKITNDGLDYLGRARTRAKIKAAGSTGNFLLNLLLIPLLGVVGAAVATVVTTAVVVGANVLIIVRELDVSARRLASTVLGVLGVTVAMAGVVWLLLPFVADIPSLVGVVLVGGLVWAVLVVAGGLLDLDQMQVFLQKMF